MGQYHKKHAIRYLLIHFVIFLTSTIWAAEDMLTPLEASKFLKLTTHADMMVFLKTVASKSKNIQLQLIGKSVEGREIPLLLISNNKDFGSKRNEKPIVYIFTQQHGNEPSGTEGALILIKELAQGKMPDLLNSMDILITPMVNPDGAEKGQRRNSRNMDLNRNHAILSEPEVVAIHDVFQKWMPEVTMDVHEYNAITRRWISHGFVKDADEMMDGGSNLNISPEILKLSNDVFIPEVGELVRQDGFTYSRYIVGAPFENQRIRHSTTDINDGRQSLGIYNTLSFLFEGKRYADTTNKIKHRTLGQLSALKAFLKTILKYRVEILDTVNDARKKLLNPERDEIVHLQMDYYPDTENSKLNLPIFDLYSWRHTEKELDRYEPVVRVLKSSRKPYAYLIPKGETKLIDMLNRHHIEMVQMQTEIEVEVEVSIIRHNNPITEEDKRTEYVDIHTKKVIRSAKEGDWFIPLGQKAGNLIPLLLEPQSSYGLAKTRSGREHRLVESLSVGSEYPVYKILNEIKLNVGK